MRDAVNDVLTTATPGRICLDLQRVMLIDSIGIGILVACFHTAAASGVKLVVSHPSPTVYRQLWVSGLVGPAGLRRAAHPAHVGGPAPSFLIRLLGRWLLRGMQRMTVLRSIGLFLLAALAEIGGAWLVWQGVREHRGLLFVGAGVVALGAYGFVATLQPDAELRPDPRRLRRRLRRGLARLGHARRRLPAGPLGPDRCPLCLAGVGRHHVRAALTRCPS